MRGVPPPSFVRRPRRWGFDLKNRETYARAISSQQEMEIVQNGMRGNYPPRELAPAYPSSAQHADIGRLKFLGFLAALAILLAAGPRSVRAASQVYRAPKVPEFSILANDGMTYTPDYLKGNVVLLMFWATWCPYCRRAMPHMNHLAYEYANSSFTILGICGGKDANAWHNYINEHRIRWPQYLDSDLRMARLFQAHGVPNFFLIDKDGYLVAHWTGWNDSITDRVEKLIDHTLAQPRRR
jgi:thiol-disulfide isomerase/thioredoxin